MGFDGYSQIPLKSAITVKGRLRRLLIAKTGIGEVILGIGNRVSAHGGITGIECCLGT